METVLPSASVKVPAFERDVMVLSPVTVHVESLSITKLQYPSPPFPALDSSLSNAGTITDADGKTVSIVGTDGTTYVEGDSDYTITVGSYQDSADTFVSTTVDDWSS